MDKIDLRKRAIRCLLNEMEDIFNGITTRYYIKNMLDNICTAAEEGEFECKLIQYPLSEFIPKDVSKDILQQVQQKLKDIFSDYFPSFDITYELIDFQEYAFYMNW